jgi:Tfp pilus assembly protein PilX
VSRARSQDGSALIIAILVLAMMLTLGLPALAYVDGQQQASGDQRSGDSAFNLAEGVLETQVYLLSRNWPASQATARPATCAGTTAVAGCPDPAQITASFTSPDWATGASWTTTIRDNSGAAANFYSDAITAGQPSWDANGDGRVWTRSQATARGRTRTLVALVQVQTVDLSLVFPHNVITAGWFQTTNNGRKVIIDTKGSSAQPSPVAVRCTTRDSSCLGYEPQKGQIAPVVRSPRWC